MIDSYKSIPSLPLFLKSHSQVQNNYNTEIIIIQYEKKVDGLLRNFKILFRKLLLVRL